MKLCTATDLPTICSICRQPPAAYDPKLTYVNMESAYDGPVVDSGEEGVPGVYVENIVVCELCVKEAARLLNLTDNAALEKSVEAWKGYADSLESEIAEKDRAISNLGYTVGVMLDTPVKRPAGRPQLAGPDSHEDEIKKMRRSAAAKGKAKTKTG